MEFQYALTKRKVYVINFHCLAVCVRQYLRCGDRRIQQIVYIRNEKIQGDQVSTHIFYLFVQCSL